MKPWEKLEVSKATYYRKKSHEVVSHETKNETPSETDETFDGTNGNELRDVSREGMERYLSLYPTAFIPNWYKAGYLSRGEASQAIMDKVNLNKSIIKMGLWSTKTQQDI
jgi:hypothetical protein